MNEHEQRGAEGARPIFDGEGFNREGLDLWRWLQELFPWVAYSFTAYRAAIRHEYSARRGEDTAPVPSQTGMGLAVDVAAADRELVSLSDGENLRDDS